MSKTFLFDTSAFITPYQQFYPFDIAPPFWSQLYNKIAAGEILVLDVVLAELLKGDDDLATWAKTITVDSLSRKSTDITEKYSDVLTYVQTCGFYQETALHNWSSAKVADAWLIAAAAARSLTIVSFEAGNAGLSSKTPSKEAKIPDVCHHFGVECIGLFEMMRRSGITLS